MKGKDFYNELKRYDEEKERKKLIKSLASTAIFGLVFFGYMIFEGWAR